jgi:Ca-activated chloride channel family protein
MPRLLWLTHATFVAWAVWPQTRTTPPVRASVDLVSLPVVVTSKGVPVAGLAADDFEIREGGVRQNIVTFADALSDTVPIRLGLMLDKSISMERDLEAASSAAIRFVNDFGEAQDVTFVEFERTVHLSRYQPLNYPQLFERMRNRKTGWGTALYDALGRYIESTRDRTGIHVLVMYTDGGDSMSDLGASAVVDLLRGGRVMLYAIGYTANQAGSSRFMQEGILQHFARETGGAVFFPGSARDLDRIYRTIRAEVRSRYTLGYVSSNEKRDGTFRKVQVRLTGPARRDVEVRTRTGYIASKAKDTP